MTSSIFIYTADMARPNCPECGRPIIDQPDNPEVPWVARCSQGHKNTYQLETEEEQA